MSTLFNLTKFCHFCRLVCSTHPLLLCLISFSTHPKKTTLLMKVALIQSTTLNIFPYFCACWLNLLIRKRSGVRNESWVSRKRPFFVTLFKREGHCATRIDFLVKMLLMRCKSINQVNVGWLGWRYHYLFK